MMLLGFVLARVLNRAETLAIKIGQRKFVHYWLKLLFKPSNNKISIFKSSLNFAFVLLQRELIYEYSKSVIGNLSEYLTQIQCYVTPTTNKTNMINYSSIIFAKTLLKSCLKNGFLNLQRLFFGLIKKLIISLPLKYFEEFETLFQLWRKSNTI